MKDALQILIAFLVSVAGFTFIHPLLYFGQSSLVLQINLKCKLL